jgi:predicted nucleic acid-binding protein
MIVLLDSNIFFSALISPTGPPRAIYDAWLRGRFRLVTCQQQIDELRIASRSSKLRSLLHPNEVGTMLNHLYGADLWQERLPRKHEAADPADSYLLDLIDAAQPDCAVTGDKRAGLLQLGTLGRTRILTAGAFASEVLHLQ